MAGSKFQYDESGGTFFYFLVSFLALILIPASYYLWPKQDGKDDEKEKNSKKCHCDGCNVKRSKQVQKEPWKKRKNLLTKLLIILGWIVFVATCYKVINLERDYVDWDPYAILQVDPGASVSEIKKAYRKLSLIYHPDIKNTGDAKKFLQLTKAHAALTDEESKKNWELYGNPDGPGAIAFGIALPSWIVEKENSIWVLGLYALVFMVALPVAVGIWWHQSIKFGGDQVLLDTTKLYYYFINKSPQMNLKRVLMVLAGSFEFYKGQNNEIVERPSDNVEVPTLISQLTKEFSSFGEKNKEAPLCYSYSLKARALLFAHLSRKSLPPSTLELDKLYIIKKCPNLIQELVQCIARMTMIVLSGHAQKLPTLDTLENCMKLSPMIIQSLWDNKNPVLQLPHITEDLLRHFVTKNRHIRTIRSLVSLKGSDRRSLLRTLSDSEYDDVMKVCSGMPVVQTTVSVEVVDDDKPTTITVGSVVTVTIHLKRCDMGSLFGQEENDTEGEGGKENQLAIGDTDANAKKKAVWQKKIKKGKATKSKKKGQGKQYGHGKKQVQNELKPSAEEPKEQRTSKTSPKPLKEDRNDGETESSLDDSDKEENKDSETEKETPNEDEEWNKIQAKLGNKDKVMETKSRVSHEVHCPFFPDVKQEYWWLYVTDKKLRLLRTVPTHITDLVNETKIELKFAAPDKVGVYYYLVHLRSDSYIDADVTETFKLDVQEGGLPAELPEYGLSDEEKEDNEDGTTENSTDDDDDFDDDSIVSSDDD